MDLERLTVEPVAGADFLATVDFIWEHGPIAGRLSFDQFVPALEEAGEPETAAALIANQNRAVGWRVYVLGDEASPEPDAPWTPRVWVLGPHIGVPEALRQGAYLLEQRDPPTGTYAESVEEIEAMLNAEPEYETVPAELIPPPASEWP